MDVPDLPPDVAVILVMPLLLAVTNPFMFTVATDVSLLVQANVAPGHWCRRPWQYSCLVAPTDVSVAEGGVIAMREAGRATDGRTARRMPAVILVMPLLSAVTNVRVYRSPSLPL